MTPDEAVELLDAGEDETAAKLVARLGRLPLALEVASAVAAIPGSSAETVLAELDDPIEFLDDAAENPFTADSTTEHALSVSATFGPSLSRLDDDARMLLTSAAAINAGPVPVSIVRPVTGLTPRELSSALGLLLSRSLARRVDGDAFELHALVAGAALQRVEDRDAFVAACRSKAAVEIAEVLGDVEDISTHPPNRHVADFGEALVLSSPTFADADAEVHVLRRLGRFFNVEFRFDEAREVEERAIALAERIYGGDDRITLNARADSTLTLRWFDDAAANAMLAESVASLERLFGPDDRDVLTTKHNLVERLKSGQPDESRRLGLEVYDARLRVFGPDDPHTLFSQHSLLAAGVLPTGYTDTLAAYEDLIERRTRVLGADHTTTLTSISNFTLELVRAGQPERAVPLAREVVQRRAALYGPDHQLTLRSRVRLASALAALPESAPDELHAIATQVLEALPGVTGTTFAEQLSSFSNLCDSLRQRGAPDASAALLDRVLPLARERLGPADRLTLLITHNQASALAVIDAAEAARRFDELISTLTTSVGEQDRLTLRARRQRELLRTPPSAKIDGQRELLRIWEQLSGPDSAEVAEALDDLAATLDRDGQHDAAHDLQNRRRSIAATGTAGWV